jgi:transposase
MRVVFKICCGLDVHKRTVTACLLKWGSRGKKTKEVRTFPTTTAELEALAEWLCSEGCQHIAMESTGVYWKPVYNILEERCEQLLLVNAHHVKNVPGRKTDVKDAEWIAELLSYGLLRGSFVPPQEIRELRDLTRYRKTLVQQRANQCNRIQKLLEDCNIKLASVATDILGVSGRDMLTAIADGESDPERLADMARRTLRKKIPQLIQALRGVITDNQRWLLGQQLDLIAHFDKMIGELNERIEKLTAPYAFLIEKLCEIPGVSQRIAQVIIAEVGVKMDQFPSAEHLASWASMCPGSHESAGKRQSGRTRQGNVWLKSILIEAGWSASRAKGTFLAARYRNIARRRGGKRASLAVGHSILKIAWYVMKDEDTRYSDIGADYYETSAKERLARQLLKRLGKLGYTVSIDTSAA